MKNYYKSIRKEAHDQIEMAKDFNKHITKPGQPSVQQIYENVLIFIIHQGNKVKPHL